MGNKKQTNKNSSKNSNKNTRVKVNNKTVKKFNVKDFELFKIDNYKLKVLNYQAFICSLALALIGFIATFLFYKEIIPNNFIAGYCWPLSMGLLMLSFVDVRSLNLNSIKDAFKNKGIAFFIFLFAITAIYFISHFYNFSNAPWNAYGLFDDAAWDIYDSKLKCFNGNTFEIIFFDDGIGRISRELLFHYVIAIFMRLFGYNLLTFNVALVLIGYVTILFTGLIAYELFNNYFYALVASVLLNFYPLHFTQVFMGHRYAICAPLIVISCWFLIKAYKNNSDRCAILGGLFAGLTMSSAIMGKQYIWALIATLIVLVLFNIRKLKELKDKISLLVAYCLGYFVAGAPLYAYIWTHKEVYTIREDTLKEEFFNRLSENFWGTITEQLGLLKETLFDPFSFSRQFSNGYPIFTWYIVVLLVIGICIALYKKNVLPIFMVLIPIAGNCVTTPYDFRFLIMAPFVMILITYTLTHVAMLFQKIFGKDRNPKLLPCISVGVISIVLISSPCKYLYELANNPNGEYLLPHVSIAASRFIQDVVVGDPEPDIAMHSDEFNRDVIDGHYDVFAATRYSYAHVHAYLYEYDASKILSFGGNFPYDSTSDEEIRNNMRNALDNYGITDKGLRIVIECSDKVEDIINTLDSIGIGYSYRVAYDVDGVPLEMYVLTVESPDVESFIMYAVSYI